MPASEPCREILYNDVGTSVPSRCSARISGILERNSPILSLHQRICSPSADKFDASLIREIVERVEKWAAP